MKRMFFAAVLCCAALPARAQEAPAGGVYELAQVETMPRPTNVADMRAALEAGYPPELRASGRQGTVVVSMVVSAEGETRDVGVVSSSEPGFDSATIAAVRLLRFTPAAVAGKPVAVRLELPIQWQPAPAVSTSPVATAVRAAEAAEPGSKTYELREVTVAPRPRNIAMLRQQLQRLYPPALRDMGRSGTVQVRFRVGTDGKVSSPTVTRSTHVDFDRATLEAIRYLEFTPARVDGSPVAVWVELPVQWEVTGLSPTRMIP
jgi:TonB family protein